MNTATLPKRTQKNLRHLLEEQARDLYNAETKYSEFLNKAQLSSTDEDLVSKFQHVKEGTSHNVVTLEAICNELDVPATGVKCEAMAGLLREAEETDEEYAHGSIKDAALIANAQRIAHYEIAGFGTARAFAKKLGLNSIAEKFEAMAEKSGAIDEKFTKIATGSWLSTGINDDAL
ncbi:DUF892 family protein [Luteolibacter sp. AS25]|uniref:DUF892 family protein n=1 Tax=Luteolibacter sp. AS25 TaxID=3135776 RepID=UPI00398B4038